MRTRKTERNLKNREKSRINNQSVGGIKKPPLRYNDIAKEVCYTVYHIRYRVSTS